MPNRNEPACPPSTQDAPTRPDGPAAPYLDRMFEGSEHLIRDVSEHDLLLVATAHCLSALDYERAVDFAMVLADRRRQVCGEPDADILAFQASRNGSS